MAIKTATVVDPFDSARERGGAGVLGMWVFIAVVAMIFLATILGYVVVRVDRPPGSDWMPPGTPGLPPALLLSTAILLVSSWTMQSAVGAARAGRPARVVASIGTRRWRGPSSGARRPRSRAGSTRGPSTCSRACTRCTSSAACRRW
jgi:hypothetical protein